jgi:hypothetical protein
LNELDLNLSALATGLIIVIVVIFCAHSRALGTAVVNGAIAGLLQVVLGRRRVLLTDGGDVGHDGSKVGDRKVRKRINQVEKRVMVESWGL